MRGQSASRTVYVGQDVNPRIKVETQSTHLFEDYGLLSRLLDCGVVFDPLRSPRNVSAPPIFITKVTGQSYVDKIPRTMTTYQGRDDEFRNRLS